MNSTEKRVVSQPVPARGWKWWTARYGGAAFIFFFVKGLVWLAIGAGAYVAIG